VQLFRQVLLAVQHAHANLVIHRDLKPGNILVTSQGEVRLLDFGIAKLLEAQGDAIEETELTRQAGRSMTPRYASPEQLMGLPLTTACDVYSLGVVFYELVCGERPYELKVESPAQLEHAILEVEPRAPSRRQVVASAADARGTNVKNLRKLLAPELDAIALRCLEKKPFGRYASVDAVLADVDRWLAGEAVLARSPGAWYRFGKFARKHQWGVGLGVAAVISLIGVATIAVILGMQARRDSARAMAARDFMLGLFKQADHEKAKGATLTAREIMEAGRRDVAVRLPGQPLLQAELLSGIGTIQMSMGEYVTAQDTFAEARRLYLALDMRREAVLALVSQADSALRTGNPLLASSLVEEARQGGVIQSSDHELKARINEVDGWIANMRQDNERALQLFTLSRREAVLAFGPHHAKSVEALRGLIYAERQLGHFEAALALQDELDTATAGMQSVDPKEISASAFDRAQLLYAAGYYAENYAHVDRAVRVCATALGANDERCRQLMVNKAQAGLRLGLADQLRADIPSLLAIADDELSPALQVDALLLLLRIESSMGSSMRQKTIYERVRAVTAAGEKKINPFIQMRALLTLAEADLTVAEPARAEANLSEVRRRMNAYGVERTPKLLLAVERSLAGVAALQIGESNRALEEIDAGQQQFILALGTRHPLVHLFSLNRAIALAKLGRQADAKLVVENSKAALVRSLGVESRTFARVVRLQNDIENGEKSGVREASITRGTSQKEKNDVEFFS
jgi:hypothetical protein